ncbi:nuclear GTPase SLIP-GC-like protein [Labeo rohita]|uniref:Nuclear GTPase SLIP-GC-like protein n=1 Tax=Labeo rohita TaxID=84645 RepID=A0A498LXV9_LABRO|nr:nuclear GTPase SLIP-GC-like protein [Labeo rohita]
MKAFPAEDHVKDLKDVDLEKDTPPIQRSLGLSWNLKDDTFTFRVDSEKKPFTRRGVLATVNSMFDPLGLAAPVTIQGKFLLRDLTIDTKDWDAPLPTDREAVWEAWKHSLQELAQFEIPRVYSTEWEKELEDLFRDIKDESDDDNEELKNVATEKISVIFGDDADQKTLEEVKNDEKFAEIETFLSDNKKIISKSDKMFINDDQFQVFTVSSQAFFDHNLNLESSETEIPKLQDGVRNLNKRIKRELIRDYVSKAKGNLSLIQSGHLDTDKKMIEMKVNICNELRKNLMKSITELDKYFDSIYDDLEQRLSKGVADSVESCAASTKKIIAPKKDGRGFHKTLGALCRNYGCYWSKDRKVVLDLNKSLAQHLHKYIDEYICQIFPVTGKTGKSLQEQINKFSVIQGDSAYPSADLLHHIYNFIEIKLDIKNGLKNELEAAIKCSQSQTSEETQTDVSREFEELERHLEQLSD